MRSPIFKVGMCQSVWYMPDFLKWLSSTRLMLVRVCACVCVCMHTYMHACVHAYMHACLFTLEAIVNTYIKWNCDIQWYSFPISLYGTTVNVLDGHRFSYSTSWECLPIQTRQSWCCISCSFLTWPVKHYGQYSHDCSICLLHKLDKPIK